VTAFRPCAANCGRYLLVWRHAKFCSHRCRQRAYRARLHVVAVNAQRHLTAYWHEAAYSHAARLAVLVEIPA
jgi:hypothetical protein